MSVVAPLKDEAPNVGPLIAAIREALDPAAVRLEIVLVDDGSADDTWMRIAEAAGADDGVRGVRLARTFGQQAAILAGLAAADGDLIAVTDADLQDPPAAILAMVQAQERTGAAVVLARRGSQRDVSGFKRFSSRAFTALLGRIAEHPVHRNVGDFYLMRRDVAQALLRATAHGGPAFLRGDLGWVGADTAAIEYERRGRPAGRTKYDLRRMRRFAWDGITSSSLVPLRLPAWLAWLAAAAAAGFAALGCLFLLPWTVVAVCATVCLAAAAILVSIGVLGEYLGRLHRMARGRPPYWVADTANVPPERLGRLAGRARGAG